MTSYDTNHLAGEGGHHVSQCIQKSRQSLVNPGLNTDKSSYYIRQDEQDNQDVKFAKR